MRLLLWLPCHLLLSSLLFSRVLLQHCLILQLHSSSYQVQLLRILQRTFISSLMTMSAHLSYHLHWGFPFRILMFTPLSISSAFQWHLSFRGSLYSVHCLSLLCVGVTVVCSLIQGFFHSGGALEPQPSLMWGVGSMHCTYDFERVSWSHYFLSLLAFTSLFGEEFFPTGFSPLLWFIEISLYWVPDQALLSGPTCFCFHSFAR